MNGTGLICLMAQVSNLKLDPIIGVGSKGVPGAPGPPRPPRFAAGSGGVLQIKKSHLPNPLAEAARRNALACSHLPDAACPANSGKWALAPKKQYSVGDRINQGSIGQIPICPQFPISWESVTCNKIWAGFRYCFSLVPSQSKS